MKRCEICGVSLTGERKICPLCGQTLDSSVTQEDFEAYPEVPIRLTYRALNWIISLWGLVMLAVLVGLKLTVLRRMPYFWPLCFGVAGAHVILLAGVRKWRNLPKSVMYGAVACVFLSLAVDLLTGWRGWSLNFVLPILGGVLESFFFALCLSVRGRHNAYGIYFFLSSLWAAIVLILALTGVITLWLPTLVATLLAVTLMAILTALQGRDFLSELSRRFHI